MLTKQDYIAAADNLKVPVAAIRAIAEQESSGEGFTTVDGSKMPVILFEPHVFWRQLKAKGLNPEKYVLGNGDILYKKWQTRPYPRTQAERHRQLARACAIDRDAALQSASYGKFQIMGFNWADCGCATLQGFINAMYASEQEQLRLFCNFLKSKGLVKVIQRHDWAEFKRLYNGAGENNYAAEIKARFERYTAEG